MYENLTPRPPSTVADYSDDLRKKRLHETRILSDRPVLRRLAKTAMTLATATIPLMHYWTEDVMPQREKMSQTMPAIHEVYKPSNPENDDFATVQIVGLSVLDAQNTARTEKPYEELGAVWAIEYDNSGIDTGVIADLIVEKAEKDGVENLNLVGHSMGGIVALEVGALIKKNTDIDIQSVVLDCTPLDLEAVRPEYRSKGEEMTQLISWIPGARYSRTLRTVVEIGARKERFWDDTTVPPKFDREKFIEVLQEVYKDKIANDNYASNGLVESQFAIIIDSAAMSSLKTLANKNNGEISSTIIFMRPLIETDDEIVDIAYSQQLLENESDKNNSDLKIVTMENTQHANPNQRPTEYRAAISRHIIPIIKRLVAIQEVQETMRRSITENDSYSESIKIPAGDK